MNPTTSTLRHATAGRGVVHVATLALGLSLVGPTWAVAPFTDNGNGTVTDSITGLVWDQCPRGLSTTTTACDTGTAQTYSWAAALTEAVTRNAANYKGFHDWRLPNLNELESLIQLDSYTAGQAATDVSVFPHTPVTGDAWGYGGHWTSTSDAFSASDAWTVDFSDGYIVTYTKTDANFVRLVRGGQTLASFDALGTSKTYTATTATSTGNGTASFTGGGASCAFGNVQFQAVPTSPPAGITMPHGAFSFATTNCGAGATLSFTLTFPEPLPVGTRYYKYGPEFGGSAIPHWYEVPGAVVSGNQIRFSITDNGLGDDNPAVGFISDPGAPGVPVTTPVPTLSAWSLLALVTLTALTGLLGGRWRKR